MNPKSHFARSCIAYSELLEVARRGLLAEKPAYLGYPSEAIIRRLLQRVVELSFEPILQRQVKLALAGSSCPQHPGDALSGDFVFSPDGCVRPRPRLLARESVRFLAQWLRCAAQAMAACRRKSPASGPWTLVYGLTPGEVLEESGGDTAFTRFCKEGPVPVLRKPERLIIQMDGLPPGVMRTAAYARHPLNAAARLTGLGLSGLLSFWRRHGCALGTYLRCLFSFRLGCLLGEDWANHSLALTLAERNSLDAVIMTNSNYSRQYLWMSDLPGRRLESHMAWYSVNSRPFMFKEDPVESSLPSFAFMKAHHWWLWTEGQAAYFRSLGLSGTMHVVGPILWRLPAQAAGKRIPGRLRVGVFNVTPVTPERQQALGLLYNYYSPQTTTRFLDDVVRLSHAAAQSLDCEVEVAVKPKRRPQLKLKNGQSHHDPSYLDHVDQLCRSGLMQAVSPQTNLFDFVQSCDVVAVIPYSSPAYIASHLGVPAIYYDPEGVFVPTHEPSALVEFAANPQELQAALQRHLAAALKRSGAPASSENPKASHVTYVAPAGLRPGPMPPSIAAGARPTDCRADEMGTHPNGEKYSVESRVLRENKAFARRIG